MQEIELRFLIPPARLKGLMRQTKVKSSQVTQLAAHYYDTPDQQLAQAGIGLRIRKEGNDWVQTIKARGDGIAARLEHNTTLDHEHVQTMLDNNALMPDLTIYKDTAIAPALAEFKLKKLAKNLTRQYVTDVERTTRLLVDDKNYKNESSIEVHMTTVISSMVRTILSAKPLKKLSLSWYREIWTFYLPQPKLGASAISSACLR